jgi:Protein of unknown function (DUF3040)
MPLSDGEQRRLDEIELALRNDDPKFASTITIDHFRRQRAIGSGALLLLGMIALVVGLVVTDALLWVGIIIGVLGFGSMVAAALMFFVGSRRGR